MYLGQEGMAWGSFFPFSSEGLSLYQDKSLEGSMGATPASMTGRGFGSPYIHSTSIGNQLTGLDWTFLRMKWPSMLMF